MTSSLFKFELDSGETSVSDLLKSVQATLNRTENADVIEFSIGLTEKDILCQVATLTTDETFDYYNLTLYRSTPCDQITDAQHNESATAANNERGEENLPQILAQLSNHCMIEGFNLKRVFLLTGRIEYLASVIDNCKTFGQFACTCPFFLMGGLQVDEVNYFYDVL